MAEPRDQPEQPPNAADDQDELDRGKKPIQSQPGREEVGMPKVNKQELADLPEAAEKNDTGHQDED